MERTNLMNVKLSKEDIMKRLKEKQAKCPHIDISNWIPIQVCGKKDKFFVKICLDCDKEIDRMETV